MNTNAKPFGMTVNGAPYKTATTFEVASRMECGSVWINKHGNIQPNAPFGGVKKSGLGVEFGEEGLAEYTDIQVVFS